MTVQQVVNMQGCEARNQCISLLQHALAEAIDLSAQAKQAHWNVKGPGFLSLHTFFDSLHSKMNAHADTLAERIVALRASTKATCQEVAKASSLPAYSCEMSCQADHLAALGRAHTHFAETLRNAIFATDTLKDPVTSDIFTSIARDVENSSWLIEAHDA